ncbi:aldehyde dehydrogenase family protein, partial [Streptomyces sp. NPDC005708]|uniref:aldehyde dehydrogenase family protein n=1 Tax=Streptomyces sp. NPDC005708 TaxID=3154564 RepID=UPI0033EEF17F
SPTRKTPLLRPGSRRREPSTPLDRPGPHGCGIITENATHGLAVARRVRTGIVHINDQSVADEPQAPFGGVKASGYGRFGGRWGIEAFSNTRWVTLATRHAHYPF